MEGWRAKGWRAGGGLEGWRRVGGLKGQGWGDGCRLGALEGWRAVGGLEGQISKDRNAPIRQFRVESKPCPPLVESIRCTRAKTLAFSPKPVKDPPAATKIW